MRYRVSEFIGAEDRVRTRACQRLRYEVYHEELGFVPPRLDHAARLDRQPYDEHCHLFVVEETSVVGCVRLQPPGAAPFYAAEEFVFDNSWWSSHRVAEGSRYAVHRAHRNGAVPLLLFNAVRRWCRDHDVSHLLSVVMLRDRQRDPTVVERVLRWALPRIAIDAKRARVQPNYRHDAVSTRPAPGVVAAPDEVPPMLRLLAGPRTTLCAAPAYCQSFEAWSLLLVTDVTRKGDPRAPTA